MPLSSWIIDNLIYNFGIIKLKTLKTYIKNNLANNFIKHFKSFIKITIFFFKKSNKSLKLCIDYHNLNNLIIKNWYSLSFFNKLLD